MARAQEEPGTVVWIPRPARYRPPAVADLEQARTTRLATPANRAARDLDGGPLDELSTSQDRCLFRLEGEYWTILFAGQVLRLRDAVGLRHLAQLLWHPGREFHARDLMRALALPGGSRGGRPPRTATPEIDAYAANKYRQRLGELQEELDEAQARGDVGRTGSIRSEIDAILRELRYGVQGTQMKVDAERARIAVTKALKVTLGRIRSGNPALGSHLDAAVKRGYVCVYRPDPRSPIRWDW